MKLFLKKSYIIVITKKCSRNTIPYNCITRYDVLTTGATAAACGRTLLGAGAGAVDVLTLARVVRPVL